MENQSKEKRSKAIKFIALGSLVAFSTTLTGCSTATKIAENEKEKDKEQNGTYSGGHYYGGGGGGGRARAPMATGGASRPAVGTVSRGWFGGFHFSGG